MGMDYTQQSFYFELMSSLKVYNSIPLPLWPELKIESYSLTTSNFCQTQLLSSWHDGRPLTLKTYSTVSSKPTMDWWIQTIGFKHRNQTFPPSPASMFFGRERWKDVVGFLLSGEWEWDLLRFILLSIFIASSFKILETWWFGMFLCLLGRSHRVKWGLKSLLSLSLSLCSFYSSTEVVVSDASLYGGRGV